MGRITIDVSESLLQFAHPCALSDHSRLVTLIGLQD
jgi:hypothetical protein